MKNRLTLLFTYTALTVAISVPALAGMQAQNSAKGFCDNTVCAALIGDDNQPMPLIRVSGDDDDDENHGWARREHDDDDDDCEDDAACTNAGGSGNPAPAGTVAPPANGLFGNGKPPVAVTN